MRESCIQCSMKHLAQAEILLEEASLGYPDHYFLAIGHLAEAESEVLAVSIEVASEIRAARLGLESTPLPYSDLLGMLKSLSEPKVDPDYNSVMDKIRKAGLER